MDYKKLIGLTCYGGLCFIAGYLFSDKLNKKKYEKKADDEIESVKKRLNAIYGVGAFNNTQDSPKKEEAVEDKPVLTEKEMNSLKNGGKQLQGSRRDTVIKDFVDYSAQYKPETSSSVDVTNPGHLRDFDISKPYIITEEEFSDSVYDAYTLFYYSDGVLADDDDNVILNMTSVIGEEAKEAINDPEGFGDCLYVRNDETQCDYEILRDEREFNKIKNGEQ